MSPGLPIKATREHLSGRERRSRNLPTGISSVIQITSKGSGIPNIGTISGRNRNGEFPSTNVIESAKLELSADIDTVFSQSLAEALFSGGQFAGFRGQSVDELVHVSIERFGDAGSVAFDDASFGQLRFHLISN